MAAQTLVGKLVANLEVDETLPIGWSTATPPNYLNQTVNFVTGNSAVSLGINQWFTPASPPITLAASASVTYVMTSLTDGLGRSLSMAGGIRHLGLIVTSRTAGDYLTVGQAGTNPLTSMFVGTTPGIKVYDILILSVLGTDKYTVAGGSNEQLKITNSGSNPITFNFVTLGCLT